MGASITGSAAGNEFVGESMMISDDGMRIAASAVARGFGRVFTLTGGAWVQTGADFTTRGSAARSQGLALSADGKTVALGFTNGFPKLVSVFSITP